MAIRPIVLDPHPVLRAIAQPVEKIDDEIKKLLDDMADTMYEANGIGLAAPQVGVSKRVVVIDYGDEFGGLIELINPVIVEKSGSAIDVEGCLSILGIRGNVERYDQITVHFQKRNGKTYEIKANGYFARVFQHEIDHLEGILYTDIAIDTFPYNEETGEVEGE